MFAIAGLAALTASAGAGLVLLIMAAVIATPSLARLRMERALARLSRLSGTPPVRTPRRRAADWTAPPPLTVRTVDAAHAPSVTAADGLATLFLWVFDEVATNSLLNRVNRIGPVYLLRGGGMLANDLTELPRMAFGRIDRMIEETEDEVRRKLAAFRVQQRLGYYRPCTLVCTDAVWTFALDRMLERCPVVVVDLSDFRPERAGITYEIGVLLDRVDLRRVVFVSGPGTDLTALRQLMDDVWSTLAPNSPNRALDRPTVTIAITTALVEENDASPGGYRTETHRDRELVASLIGAAAQQAPHLPLPPPRPLPPPAR